jgi:hypothetical protein
VAQAILSDLNVMDITAEEQGEFSIEGFANPEDAIAAIIRRHPMREEQVIETLKHFEVDEGAVQESLLRLAESGKIKKVEYRDRVFWLPAEGTRGQTPLLSRRSYSEERNE